MSFYIKAACVAAISCLSISVHANGADAHQHDHTKVLPQTHAPIGVMGDHMHNEGEFMFSYRFMNMDMTDNIQGRHNISSDEIATTVPNVFGDMPPTVRVVPQTMTTKMHMLGVMYAPTNDITLMLMLNYLEREMTLTTYQGMAGTTQLGDFDTESSGLGDTKIGLLYRLHDSEVHHFHLNANWQIPTGDIEEESEVLTPMNMRTTLRMPYTMQLGSGSNIFELGTTYNGYSNKSNWGGQILYSAVLDTNDEGYQLGDKLQLTAWYGHQLSDFLSSSIRLSYITIDAIDGMDEMIMAPVTTANPENYGGDYFNASFGLNTVIANKHRVAFEYTVPVEQNANGVQMKMDKMFTVGYQIAF
jgi:hypothetical protein